MDVFLYHFRPWKSFINKPVQFESEFCFALATIRHGTLAKVQRTALYSRGMHRQLYGEFYLFSPCRFVCVCPLPGRRTRKSSNILILVKA